MPRNKTLKRLEKEARKRPRVGPADNLDELCELFMRRLQKRFAGHKSEITPWELAKETKMFERGFGIRETLIIDALMRRGWLEPSAADAYTIRHDLVRK